MTHQQPSISHQLIFAFWTNHVDESGVGDREVREKGEKHTAEDPTYRSPLDPWNRCWVISLLHSIIEKLKFQHRKPQARWALGLVAVLAFLTWPGFDVGFGGAFVDPSEIPVTWDQITPSRSLHYHNCGDEFQCARLKVPMDYNRTDGKGRSFDLAVVRLPAKVPVTDPRYGGAVLINPGMYNGWISCGSH